MDLKLIILFVLVGAVISLSELGRLNFAKPQRVSRRIDRIRAKESTSAPRANMGAKAEQHSTLQGANGLSGIRADGGR